MWALMMIGSIALANANKTEDKPKTKASYGAEADAKSSPYVFGWMTYPESSLKLRGGTTKDNPVKLATEPSTSWQALRADGLTALQRDRAAILAMAGDYRVSFDFLDVETYGPSTAPSTPYRSWATERVYVLEDSEQQISLQHILVMYFLDKEGVRKGPMVVKHWRQDWVYEPTTALEYTGMRQWTNRKLDDAERKGLWQQTVYQVDDSPRYAMRGTWQHNANYSAWDGRNAWRPLPRREHSIRSDYHTLAGTNRITVQPTGWVHTQDNIKTVLSAPGVVNADNPALARELGVNRYERIVDFDFSAGDAYWEETADFWKEVRTQWTSHLGSAPDIKVATTCEEKRLYEHLFALAKEKATSSRAKKKRSQRITELLGCTVSSVQSTP